MQELLFLHSALRLMLVDICMKFHDASLYDFKVIERTQWRQDFVRDKVQRTDGRTDGRPGKNNMSPNPSGGDITRPNAETQFK